MVIMDLVKIFLLILATAIVLNEKSYTVSGMNFWCSILYSVVGVLSACFI